MSSGEKSSRSQHYSDTIGQKNKCTNAICSFQVKELMMARDADGDNILHWAADGGGGETVEGVLQALRSRLNQQEVLRIIQSKNISAERG